MPIFRARETEPLPLSVDIRRRPRRRLAASGAFIGLAILAPAAAATDDDCPPYPGSGPNCPPANTIPSDSEITTTTSTPGEETTTTTVTETTGSTTVGRPGEPETTTTTVEVPNTIDRTPPVTFEQSPPFALTGGDQVQLAAVAAGLVAIGGGLVWRSRRMG